MKRLLTLLIFLALWLSLSAFTYQGQFVDPSVTAWSVLVTDADHKAIGIAPGTAGGVLVSAGPGATPYWSTPGSGVGGDTYDGGVP